MNNKRAYEKTPFDFSGQNVGSNPFVRCPDCQCPLEIQVDIQQKIVAARVFKNEQAIKAMDFMDKQSKRTG